MSFHLGRPRDEELRQRLASQSSRDFSYAEVGLSRDPARVVDRRLRRRYALHHHRVRLGRGEACFRRGREALRAWAPFRQDGLELCWPDTPLEVSRCVGVLTRAAGLWSFHPSRVVYVDEEVEGPVRCFAFAYGTLPDHSLRGEERFAVEHHPGNDGVWFDVLAFSRPSLALARVVDPWLRRVQARFGAGALAAMQRAVEAGRG